MVAELPHLVEQEEHRGAVHGGNRRNFGEGRDKSNPENRWL
jgi:hypothetical protein